MSPDAGTTRGEDGPPHALITAAGRRTGLVQAFVDATHARGARLVAADVDGLAPALFLADEAVRILRTSADGYLDDLLATVERQAIRLVVPTIDTDLPVLAAARDRFEAIGCRALVSDARFIATTMDKQLTGEAFGAQGIRVPRSWIPPIGPRDALPARIFVKPRTGSASQDTYEIDRDRLDTVAAMVPNPIVQEVLRGAEITIDALLDLDGRPIHYVPRRRIRTLGGESIQGVTLEHDTELEGWIEDVLQRSSAMGALGPLTLQAFLTDDGPVLTEINARFGGGFPLALAAGGAYPGWLLDMLDGVAVPARLRAYETGLYMTRANAERFTREPRW